MPTYISLLKWTEQGVRNLKDTVARTEQNRAAIEKAGGRLIGAWWTQGACDLVAVAEWPDDESSSAYMLALGMTGNVRSETMRAFTAEEMQRIIQKMS
ncbi:MAG: GYD domain-containing protein [Chloroflexota bacterium]|nr:GYD domain-containing protein [Chloroflexota bacterium]